MVPAVTLPVCSGPLAPVCSTIGGAGSAALGAGASAVLSAMAGWVVTGAGWLLDQVGAVMSTSTRIDVTAAWFTSHYSVMAGIGAALALPMLLVGAVQAVYRQSTAVLVRSALVHLPLAAVLSAAAAQLVQLALAATDALCATVSAGSGGAIDRVLAGLANALVVQAGGGPYSAPLFVVVLGALVVTAGALVLWLELLVRTSAVYVAVLFLPLALASLVWPAVSHWCRRLVETLVALVLSKFVMVAILSLAAGALGSGTATGFSAVLAGGALLLLAAFAPFALLRLVPAIEAGAVHQLEGARQRVRHAAGSVPESAAAHVLRGIQEGRQPALDPGQPGAVHSAALAATGAAVPGDGAGTDAAVTDLPGEPSSDAAFSDVMHRPQPPPSPLQGTGGILPGSTGAPLWSPARPHDRPTGAPDGPDDPPDEPGLLDSRDHTDWDGGWSDGGWDGGPLRTGRGLHHGGGDDMAGDGSAGGDVTGDAGGATGGPRGAR
ncbi:MAG: hypothetical protein ACRDYZ_02685 [Acidimicrobiales bacterium]